MDDTITAHKCYRIQKQPWRQLLSLPIPSQVTHPMCTGSDLIARVARTRLTYAENLVSWDLLGACGVRLCSGRSCVRGAQVRRGCAAGVWTSACVRGGGAWHRRWAAYVAAAGSFPATPTRVLVELTGTWRVGRRCVFQQFGVGHASALGLGRSPVAISVLLRWSPSGAYHGCCGADSVQNGS